MISRALLLALASAAVVPVLAHGGHDQEPLGADTDWATRHLAGMQSHVCSIPYKPSNLSQRSIISPTSTPALSSHSTITTLHWHGHPTKSHVPTV